jgi:aspartate/methionine/tyrosine aminotransferase
MVAATVYRLEMNSSKRTRQSEFMEWAKLHSQARFNLASSDVLSVSASEFPLRTDDFEITGPGGYGYEPLQERIARHCQVASECVVAANGTSMANHLAMAGLIEAGAEVLIEQPAYGPLLDVANYLHARVRRFARRRENGFAIDLDEIESAITPETRLIVLSNLHNPSGALTSKETLRTLAEIAAHSNAYVLVDEVYLEMVFARDPPFAFGIGQSLPNGNPFVVTNSLTKTYGLSGLRCGWILAEPELAKSIWRLNDLFGVNAPHSAEELSVAAFDHLEGFRERTRALLSRNRVLFDSFLDSRNDLECSRPPAGTVVFPRLLRGDPATFLERLRDKYQTSVVPGRFFDMPDHFRIGIGGETESLRAGLERLGWALDELRK